VEKRRWTYRRRQPEGTVLYEAVTENLATLLAEASEVGGGLPGYVERVLPHMPYRQWALCFPHRGRGLGLLAVLSLSTPRPGGALVQ